MDFLDLQNEVLSDRFDESKRPNAKNWLNYRYGRLWGMEAWTFKYQVTNLTVTAGNSSASRGNIGTIVGLWNSSVSPYFSDNFPVRPEDLYDFSTLTAGTPYNYTVIGDNIFFERPMLTDQTFKVISEQKFTALTNDTDIPLIPTEFHLVLASGAASHGLRLENDPSWQAFEDEWTRGIEDMRKNYLTSVRVYNDALPAWP